jgi:cytochrome c-type biogenesis protein CcmH
MWKPLLLAILGLALLTSTTAAQSPDAQKLYTKLYCPLCGGVRLDVCQLKVCDDMKQVINQKLAAGESEQQIIAYFRQQYGDQVLGYPPAEGINLVPWLIPFILVALGAIALWRMALNWTRQSAQASTIVGSAVPKEVAARIERDLNE